MTEANIPDHVLDKCIDGLARDAGIEGPGFTPGPWKWSESNGPSRDMPVLHGAGGLEVMDFGDSETYYPTAGSPPDKADARLIAAAPDLYAALHDLLVENDNYEGCPRSSPAWNHARNILAKATGQ